jgi:hypothetical protein
MQLEVILEQGVIEVSANVWVDPAREDASEVMKWWLEGQEMKADPSDALYALLCELAEEEYESGFAE